MSTPRTTGSVPLSAAAIANAIAVATTLTLLFAVRTPALGQAPTADGRAAAPIARATAGPVAFEIGAWMLTPVRDKRGVSGMLALRSRGGLPETGIAAVWYRRDTGGTWSASAWTDPDPSNAIAFVKAELRIADTDDTVWALPDRQALRTVADPSAPEPYVDGILASDPLFPLLSALRARGDLRARTAFVDAVAAAGGPVGDFEREVIDLLGATCPVVLSNGRGGVDAMTAVFEALSLGAESSPDGDPVLADSVVQTNLELALDGDGGGCIPFCLPLTTHSKPMLVGCNLEDDGWALTGCNWDSPHCAMICHFQAQVTCEYLRVCVKRAIDCSACVWTQTGSRAGMLYETSTEYILDCNDPGASYAPPTTPDDPTISEPFGSTGGWAPGPPC